MSGFNSRLRSNSMSNLIPYLDKYQFFVAFHVSDIYPLLDKYQEQETLRKADKLIFIQNRTNINRRKTVESLDICPILFIFAHL